jgi:HPt (histidine-containing phosphotransfer) domain-containing protein
MGWKRQLGKPFTTQELWRCLMKYFKPTGIQEVNGAQYMYTENELQQKFIDNFVNYNRNKYNEIKGAIDSGDINLAFRLAHSLKSNAGQIKKSRLQKAAKEIETNLKNGENHVTPHQLEVLETELNTILRELSPKGVEPTVEYAAPVGPMDRVAALEFLEKIEQLLMQGNPECLSLINGLSSIPGSERLIQEITNFDFEIALITLSELRTKI